MGSIQVLMQILKEENETAPYYSGTGTKQDIAKIIKIAPLKNIPLLRNYTFVMSRKVRSA